MKPPPVILFYDHVAKLSGGEILLWHLVSNLNRDKFLPVVVLGEEGPLREKLNSIGVETHVFPIPEAVQDTKKDDLGKRGIAKKLATVFALLPYIWRLHTFIRRRRVAMVHTNSLKSDILGGIAGRLARRPVIWHVHDCIDAGYLPGAAIKFFRLLARRLPHYIISVSRAVEETLRLPAEFPAKVIHNGIPWLEVPHSQSAASNAGPVIGIVGRITPWKGQDVFLRAASKIRERFPTARFQIVGGALFGEDDYWEELQELTHQLKMEDAVEFLGFRNDVPEIVAKFDLFVHASTSPEPFGIVIIEAMLESKPVVATRGGGVPEIVCEGETGLLVPMGDEQALADAIASLLDNPQEMKRMGEAGRKRVHEHFLIGDTVQGVEDIYGSVLASSR
jgi:glycosyltransferase involved in cell wall biosynthesis